MHVYGTQGRGGLDQIPSGDRGQPSALPRRAARTIARMPALVASGSAGQASTIRRRSASNWHSDAGGAPDSAPLFPESLNSPAFSTVFDSCGVYFRRVLQLVARPRHCKDLRRVTGARADVEPLARTRGFLQRFACALPPHLPPHKNGRLVVCARYLQRRPWGFNGRGR